MLSENELNALKQKVAANDPTALYAYAKYLAENDDPQAEKYFEFAAQLGQPDAACHMGDLLMLQGDTDRAEVMYRTGAKAGLLDCAVKLAVMQLSTNEHAALVQLEDLAESGITAAAQALADYYKAQGNRKQFAYWSSLAK